MGHERLGLLPRSKKWKDIIEDIRAFQMSGIGIDEIASKTLKGVISRFEKLPRDEGVIASFKFLIIYAVSLKNKDPKEFLEKNNILLPSNFTLTDLAKGIILYVNQTEQSKEYSNIAKKSSIDAIIDFYDKHKQRQLSLFEIIGEPFENWRELGTGAGFCEISRHYFYKFTTYYLKYFLERETSSITKDLQTRQFFNKKLEENIQNISKYAFETSKITQSYAAGWFNKKTREALPSEEDIKEFIRYSFGKMREEILRDL